MGEKERGREKDEKEIKEKKEKGEEMEESPLPKFTFLATPLRPTAIHKARRRTDVVRCLQMN